MDAALRTVLDPAVAPPAADTLRAWWDATAAQRGAFAEPIDRALAGGAWADRLGFAFAGGYAEALRALAPAGLGDGITALCATEEGGAHPRAIRTSLVADGDGFVVSGKKSWATVASSASSLLVVASTGVVDGQNRLRVVRIAASAPGVTMTDKAAAFVPEIPHAEVALDRVAVAASDVLPGDGYTRYLKPFRTIEDLHVHAALAGYLIGVVRRHALPQALAERLLALAVATRALAVVDPTLPSSHLALAGVLALIGGLVEELEQVWTAPSDERTRWQRDRGLLRVASTARAQRRERAWESFTR